MSLNGLWSCSDTFANFFGVQVYKTKMSNERICEFVENLPTTLHRGGGFFRFVVGTRLIAPLSLSSFACPFVSCSGNIL